MAITMLEWALMQPADPMPARWRWAFDPLNEEPRCDCLFYPLTDPCPACVEQGFMTNESARGD